MLERSGVEVEQERPARKRPLADQEALTLLSGVSEVVIARGAKTAKYEAADVTPEMLKGPSGTYRAPMLVRGKKMLVGFSASTLAKWFGSSRSAPKV